MTNVTTANAADISADNAASDAAQKTLKHEDLRQFTGTETWWRHPLNRNVLYTDGAKYVADMAGAYWLLDEIACAQLSIDAVVIEAFQLWRLTVKPDQSATLMCEDGNNNVVYSKAIEFTDFPLDEIKFYYTDHVILLPSEY